MSKSAFVMDFSTFRNCIDLIRKDANIDVNVFIHTLDTVVLQNFLLPPDQDAGRDYLYVNCVFLLIDDGWIYLTNANSGPKSSIVKMYSSSKINLQSTIDPKVLSVINHYFLQRQKLIHYHIASPSQFDPNDMLLTLLNFHYTVAQNRAVRYNLLEEQESVQNVLEHFRISLKVNEILPFHRSIFRDHFDSLEPVQEYHVLSDEKLHEMLEEESVRRKPPPPKRKVRVRVPSPEPAAQIEDFGFEEFEAMLSSEATTHRATQKGLFESFLKNDTDNKMPESSFNAGNNRHKRLKLSSDERCQSYPVTISPTMDCNGDLDRDELYEKVLKKEDEALIKKMKNRMVCRKSECFVNHIIAKNSDCHYHCLRCQQYKFKNFFRVVQHSLNSCTGPARRINECRSEPSSSSTEPANVQPPVPSCDSSEPTNVQPSVPSCDRTESASVQPSVPSYDSSEPTNVQPSVPSCDSTESVSVQPSVPSCDSSEPTNAETSASSSNRADGPTSTSSLSKAFSKIQKALQGDANSRLQDLNPKMRCKNKKCIKNTKSSRTLHFHCLFCKSHTSIDYKRGIAHMLKCPSNGFVPSTNETIAREIDCDSSAQIVKNSTAQHSSKKTQVNDSNENVAVDAIFTGLPSVDFSPTKTDNDRAYEDNDIKTCWDHQPGCTIRTSRKSVKHYHCAFCGISNSNIGRLKIHVFKCKIKKNATNCSMQVTGDKTNNGSPRVLQSELICAESGIYLVRKGTQGPAAPIHVKVSKKGWDCTAPDCKDMYNFHRGSLNPAFMCIHATSCINKNLSPKSDLVNNETSFDSFGDSTKEVLLNYCKTARDFGCPVVKQFLPTMIQQESTSRYIYYSVFAGDTKVKYYSKLGRVVVSYDRHTKVHKCECNIGSCVHKKIATLVSEKNPLVQEQRPEDDTDENEIKSSEAMMEYVLEHKLIPFDVSEYMCAVEKKDFAPMETKCHKCIDVDLVVSNSNPRGCIFTLNEKRTGINITTKSCPQCSIQYRYAEYSEGYFNFNNSSIFTISFMELCLRVWVKNASLSSFFDIIKVVTKMDYNIHLVLDAVKSYLALKNLNLNENFTCYRCGHFPVSLFYDVIRKVCFDVDPRDVGDHEYDSAAAMQTACSRHGLAYAYLDRKSVHFNANMKHFSVKLGPHLPPILSSNNFGGLAPYTRPLINSDKAEEVRLPLERIEQIVSSKNGYKELKQICNSLKIETKGGKSHMVARLVDSEGNKQLYSVVRKKFTNIVGKSGGVLRAFCTHGSCYELKFLTLPESVADYTNVMTAFKVQPSFNFTDMPSVVANHTSNHFPNFFRPHKGRIDNPEDPNSELYKDGRKTALFEFDTFSTCKLNIEKYNHDTIHPISLLSSVLSLSDVFHEKNHHEFDCHLRSVNNTNLAVEWNTSVVEQNNHVLSMKKSYCNEMGTDNHIKFVSYLTCIHNKKLNDSWKAKMEKSTGKKCVVDDLGFLVGEHVDKSQGCTNSFDMPSTKEVKSPHPTAMLQDPSGDASALNSTLYALSLSSLADPISDSQASICHELFSFVNGDCTYDQQIHFRMKNLIDKKVRDTGGEQLDPSSLFELVFLPELTNLGVLLAFDEAASSNIGIAVSTSVQNQSKVKDFIVLKRSPRTSYYNGCKTHFDVKYEDSNLRFNLTAFVSLTSPKVFSCFARQNESFYEMCNTKSNILTGNTFLEFARSAVLVIFKLTTPLSYLDSVINKPSTCKKVELDELDTKFDFDPLPKQKRLNDFSTLTQRKKHKIGIGHITHDVPKIWLSASPTGRLNLYSDQYRICQSANLWYDDIIINSYARMCQVYRTNSFIHQDTCLSSPHHVGGFKSVDQKFIQILNPHNNHWFCISNALTFRNEPNVVEIFDSIMTAEHLRNVRILNSSITRFILQLKPHTGEVRYIQTQVQNNGYDCGPFALSFLWSLSKGHHPLQYEQLRFSPIVRNKVRQSFTENKFIPPCNTVPRMIKKPVLKSYTWNSSTKKFTE